MQYEIKNIAGIDCIFAPMNDSNSITIEVMVKAGNIYETKQLNGISHFLEHMFFKGGQKYTTPHSVAQAVENFGGTFNAYTGGDRAGYYVKCAPDFALKALDVLADMMVHCTFPKEEMEREKKVVIQEIKMYDDDPQSVVADKWQEWYFGENSYGWTTLGPVENIKNFTQDDLFAHKEALYAKDNLIIVIAGNIKEQAVLEDSISQLFLSLPQKRKFDRPTYTRQLPQEKTGFCTDETQQNHLIISAPGFTGDDDKKYAASIFTTMLGGNMSSRLFQNVRERHGLCYYIGATHYAKQYDGIYFIRAGIDKERFDFGIEKINQEIDSIARGDITDEEFANAIGYRTGSLQMGIETTDSLASFVGNQYLIYGRIRTIEDVIENYKKVTVDDIKSIAGMLSDENRFLYYVK